MITWKVVFAILILAAVSFAVPLFMNYQAKLTDTLGVPLNGSYDITFRIYDVAGGPGSALWSETHYGVEVVDGFFSVRLGEAGGPLNLPFDTQYWIEIAIGTDVLSPREPLSTNAYAFTAGNAELVNGEDINDVFRITDSLYLYLNSRDITEDTLHIWASYLSDMHDYVVARGWDLDTIAYFGSVFDSLRTLDMDSLINWYSDSLSDAFVDMLQFTYIDDGFAVLFDGDTIAKGWFVQDSTEFYMTFDGDTTVWKLVEISGGYAYMIDDDTIATVTLQSVEDTLSLEFNDNEWMSLIFLDDPDGFGILGKIGSAEDTLMYLNYDSVMFDMLGFTDVDSVLEWYFDSLTAEYPLDTLSEIWNNSDIGFEASGDSAGIIGLGGLLGGWFEGDSAGIYATNTGAGSMAAYIDGDAYVDGDHRTTGYSYSTNQVSVIPLWQAGAAYVMNNIAGQDLFNCESGLIPTVYSAAGDIQIKLVVRVQNNTAGSSNFQIRAHNGTTEVYPIIFSEILPWTPVQTGWIVESGWEDFNAGITPWEIHLHGWVDSGSTDFTSAYLLVRAR